MPGLTRSTARLDLEPWTDEHTEILRRLFVDERVMSLAGGEKPWPSSWADRLTPVLIEHWERNGFGWRAARLRETGQLVGFFAVSFASWGFATLFSDVEHDGPRPNNPDDDHVLGWWLVPGAWGRGLAREGAQAVVDEGFEVGAPHVTAQIHADNAPSRAVAQAVGLELQRTTPGLNDSLFEEWQMSRRAHEARRLATRRA